ncbi:transglutaminase domain-containing protein [bacterium]|nr:transglutaminase domain-containing protein [bacterium]
MSFLGNYCGFCVNNKNSSYSCSFIFKNTMFKKDFISSDILQDKNLLDSGAMKIERRDVLKKFKPIDLDSFRKIKVKEINDKYPIRFIIKTSYKIFENSAQKFIKKENDFFYYEIVKSEYSEKNSQNIEKQKINNQNRYVLDFINKHNIKNVSDALESVHKNFKYEDTSKTLTVSEIFKSQKGDCTELAIALEQILKTLSTPSKIVYGIIYKNGFYSFHSWVEFYDGFGWKGIDPTFNRFQLDPFWIKLSENRVELEHFLGMKISIVENY